MPSRTVRGWAVALSATAINLCLGVLYSWSVFAKALVNHLGWSKTAASWPYTMAIILFALLMIPAGALTDRWGPRLTANLGAVLAGSGLVLSAFALKPDWMILTFGILFGAGCGFGFSATIPAAIRWFPPSRRGLVAGVVVGGFALASVYVAPLTQTLLDWGMKMTFLIEGGAFLVNLLLLSQFLSFPESGSEPREGDPPPKNRFQPPVCKDYTWLEMIKTPSFYSIWTTYLLGCSAGLMIIGHLAKIVEIQAQISYGFLMVAVLGISNAGGRIVSGFLGDLIGCRKVLLLVFALQAVNMLFFPFYLSPGPLIVGTVVAGYSYGSLASVVPSITYEYYGTLHGGTNYGIIFSAWGLGGLLGPIMAAKVADLTGEYTYAFLVAGAFCIAGALLVARMGKRP